MIEKEVTRVDKNGEEITKIIPYNSLIAQDLQQAYSQVLSIIFLKKLIELNGNTDMIIKNARLVELDISIASVFWNLLSNRNCQRMFDEKLKEQFFNA